MTFLLDFMNVYFVKILICLIIRNGSLLKSADNRKLINLFFVHLKTWMYGVLEANKQKLCIQEMLMQ